MSEPREIVCHPEPIHEYFGLSYASYLVLPRSVLQSMPVEWQQRFVGCLKELGQMFDRPLPLEGTYYVRVKADIGRYLEDPLQDYERGRYRVPLKPLKEGQV